MSFSGLIPKKWYWRLAIVVIGTMIISSITHVIMASPNEIQFPQMLYIFFLLLCIWIPGPKFMLAVVSLAIWWIVDSRRRYVLPLAYFGILGTLAILNILSNRANEKWEAELREENAKLEKMMDELQPD